MLRDATWFWSRPLPTTRSRAAGPLAALLVELDQWTDSDTKLDTLVLRTRQRDLHVQSVPRESLQLRKSRCVGGQSVPETAFFHVDQVWQSVYMMAVWKLCQTWSKVFVKTGLNVWLIKADKSVTYINSHKRFFFLFDPQDLSHFLSSSDGFHNRFFYLFPHFSIIVAFSFILSFSSSTQISLFISFFFQLSP